MINKFHTGLLIGQRAGEWKHEMPGLRLSQLLDLYYLNSRFREDFHVCKRESAFNTFIRDKKQTLIEQVGTILYGQKQVVKYDMSITINIVQYILYQTSIWGVLFTMCR